MGYKEMKKRRVAILMCLLFFVPVILLAAEEQGIWPAVKKFRAMQEEDARTHRMQQMKEDKEFFASLKGASQAEKKEALNKHNEMQRREDEVFWQKEHEENILFLREQLKDNKKLTGIQKGEIVTFIEKQYQEDIAFREQQRSENAVFFKKMAKRPGVTQEARKKAIKEHFRGQNEENLRHREKMEAEADAEHRKISSEIKSRQNTQKGKQ